jgi:hypothetical protein
VQRELKARAKFADGGSFMDKLTDRPFIRSLKKGSSASASEANAEARRSKGLPSTLTQTGCPVAALNKNTTGIHNRAADRTIRRLNDPPPNGDTLALNT